MRPLQIVAICIMPLMVACVPTGPSATSDYAYSYFDRYPLVSKPVSRIDVAAFRPASGDAERVQSIARQYLRSGQGKIVIFVPQSGPVALSSGNWVRQELIAKGVPASRIQWDARSLPGGIVRIAFATTNEKTAWNCTNFNEDVQQRAEETSYLNRETVNFGCAYQSNMRAQAENQTDFTQPRAETAIDPVRTANAVRQLRSKQAPPGVGVQSP